MRFFQTFVFLLITGILGSTIAEKRETYKGSERVPDHVYILGYVNTTVQDIEKFDIKLCETNGGPNMYEEHKKSRDQYSQCIDSLHAEIRQELSTAEYSSRVDRENAYMKSYCRKQMGFGNCLRNFTDSMKTCLDTTKHESANVLYNVVSSVMRFMCEDGGTRLEKFHVAGGDECVEWKMSAVLNCANKTVGKYIQSTISDGAAIGGLGKYHLLVPDEKKCTIFEEFRVCIMGVLKSCQHPTTDLANSIFKLVKKASTCDRFLKSNASPGSIVNVLLITAVMGMFLRFE